MVKVMFWGLKNEFDQFGFDRDDRVAGVKFARGVPYKTTETLRLRLWDA